MVKINGELFDAQGKTIAQLVSDGGYDKAKVAVELNEMIVPKAEYEKTQVQDGDSVEIVGFVGGG